METHFIKCINCVKEGCPLKCCSDDWLEKLDKYKKSFCYPARECFVREGSHSSGLYFIYNGKVKLTTTGINDKEQIIGFAGTEDFIDLGFADSHRVQFNAVTLEETYVAFLDKEIMQETLYTNPGMIYALLNRYSEGLRKMEYRLKCLAQMNIRERVAEALLFLEYSFGLNEHQALNAEVTRQDIADLAGTQIDHISRNLTSFEKEGLIERKQKQIIIKNKKGLKIILKNFGMPCFFNNQSTINQRYNKTG